jgi:hypothetical protein
MNMLYKNKCFTLFVLIVALCISLTFAAKKQLTPEQQALKNKMRAERKKKSEAADKLIRHTTSEEFKSTVLDDTENLWVVFFGSSHCPHTQKFNPKWLQFQNNMDNGLYGFENIKITKIECYGKQIDFCVSQNNQFWPELMFYYKGVKRGVYNEDEDEIEDIVKYIKANQSRLMKEKTTKSTKTTKTTKTVKQDKSGFPTSKPSKNPPNKPVNKPSKQPPTFNKPTKSINKTKEPVAKPTKNVVENDNIIDNNNDNNIDNNIDNGIDNSIDIDNDINNEIEDVNEDNNNNDKSSEFLYNETEQGSSHVVAYSIGGCAACIAGFLFAKKRFRGHGYSRIGDARNPQMKYKYDKHIV